MNFEKVQITEFRVYPDLMLDFAPGLNVLVGPNASGKTTILEALSLLATGRSFRGATDPEMVRAGQAAYRVSGRFTGKTGSHSVETAFQLGEGADPSRKVAKVDGHALARTIDLLGRVPLLSFSPDDLALAKGGPAERRRFLDLLLAQTSAPYRDQVARYQRTLAQRNALLGQLAARRAAAEAAAVQLEPWDESLAAEAAQIQAARAAAVRAIAPVAGEVFAALDGRSLEVTYLPSVFDPSRRGDELRRAVTLSGAHRDELALAVDGRDARRYASQGQQRSVVLALKLAALDELEAGTGETPVLLLDDVMSELDPGRGALLVPLLLRGQVFVTTTDRLSLARALDEKGFQGEVAWSEVGEGRVIPVETTSAAPASPAAPGQP